MRLSRCKIEVYRTEKLERDRWSLRDLGVPTPSRSNIELRPNRDEVSSHGDATCRLGRHKGRKYKTLCGTFVDRLCLRGDRGNVFVGCEEFVDYLELYGRGGSSRGSLRRIFLCLGGRLRMLL